jgi:hypothetical protein
MKQGARIAVSLLAALLGTLMIVALLSPGRSGARRSEERVADLEVQLAHLRSEVEAIGANARAAALLSANRYLVDAQFHSMDEAIGAGLVNPRYISTVRDTRTVVGATQWPPELAAEASAFTSAAERLEESLAAQDVATASLAAADTHDTQHTLTHAIFGYLAVAGDVAAEPASDDYEPGIDQAAVQEPSGATPETTPPETTVPETTAPDTTFELQVGDDGGAKGGPATHVARRGDSVRLTIDSAASGSVHLHGYGLESDLAGGSETRLDFETEATGRFPLEFHPTGGAPGVVIGYLEVRP